MKRRKFISNIVRLGALPLVMPKGVIASYTAANTWQVKQFKDSGLAHFSYAVLAGNKVVVVDPARDPAPYYQFAKDNGATIVGVIETHPHADFVSAHLEIHKRTGAAVYTSSLLKPSYPFSAFDAGTLLRLTDTISLKSIATPGHAPDGISAILQVGGKDIAVFSGDSLLIGDVGRPDLREYAGDIHSKREELAAQMYTTVWEQFGKLDDDVILYPAHGAGSLCGKTMRDADSSTIGYEKLHNHAFKQQSRQQFVDYILTDLPSVPPYFPYNVAVNVKGAAGFTASIANVAIAADDFQPASGEMIVDGRAESLFQAAHISGSYNVPDGNKFETWLGTLIHPDKQFYLAAENKLHLTQLIAKAAKIGYETKIKRAFVYGGQAGDHLPKLNLTSFNQNPAAYTIIDVRTGKEALGGKLFSGAVNIPLQELEHRIKEVPAGKPILVHCATGYRSAIGSSIIKKYFPDREIYDLGKHVTEYKNSGLLK